MDFCYCWELYKERGIEPEEEVIVSYSPPEGKVYRLFGKNVPPPAHRSEAQGESGRDV